jgi:O-methyltransferase
MKVTGPLKSLGRSLTRSLGYEVVRRNSPEIATDDLDPEFMPVYERCREFTMTSLPRMYALYQALLYIERARIEGAFVECGVWRGGSAMLAALVFLRNGSTDRELVVYDTFEGMPAPGPLDVDFRDRPASAIWRRLRRGTGSDWCYATEAEVKANLGSTGYPESRIRMVKGRVEETIPTTMPQQMAILRLDTDWYESTRHELVHLYPRLSRNGVLIVDDYGYWQGARRAVDEYFGKADGQILLHRIDTSGRIGLKTG